MKMRVMYFTRNGQMKTYAEAIGQAFGALASEIPPAYPCENERLVLIGLSVNKMKDDVVSRFCSQLTAQKANNVALFIDGKSGTNEEAAIRETLKNAGTNVLDDTYYCKCGIFGKGISIEKRQEIVDWVRKVQNAVAQQ